MGEHLPCKQGVMGSNPIISTSGNVPRRNFGNARLGPNRHPMMRKRKARKKITKIGERERETPE